MSKRLDEMAGAVSYDNLLVDNFPPADIFSVTVEAGSGNLARGTALARDTTSGKMKILGTTGETLKANCILAEAANATSEAKALAYRTGHFNTGALILKEGYTLTDVDKEAFRAGGILLSDAL